MGRWPFVTVHNLQRKISVNVAELEKFETAQRHARAFGNSLLRELKLYIVHGLLHLHRFDDQTPGKAHKMKAAQSKILRACSRHR